MDAKTRKLLIVFLIIGVLSSFLFGFCGGILGFRYFNEFFNVSNKGANQFYKGEDNYENKIIEVVQKSENSVVSIIATKDLPVIEEYYINPFENFGPFGFGFEIPQYREKGTEERKVSAGSGFVVDAQGYIVTNKHVVEDKAANYTVLMNDGKKYPAEIIARDIIEDFVILKINKTGLIPLLLGDSNEMMLGQTVIAIGNALGEFQNTVSVGVISGLSRSIEVSDFQGQEIALSDVVQTDAAINQGNSGGPLLNLKGEVVGLNTAKVFSAENIGFAIPVNKIKNAIKQVIETGEIKIPYLGVRYLLINPTIQEEKNLTVDYGVLLIKGNRGEPAIEKNSPAWYAGFQEGDIILEINNKKINTTNQLATLIREYNVGDKVDFKILRQDQTLMKEIVLGEFPQ